MDVLSPQIQVIDGIRYRINPGDYESNYERGAVQYMEEEYEEVGLVPPCEDTEDDSEIEIDKGGRFRLLFHVPKTYIPHIIGSKGATRKRIESETKTRINVPRMGHDGDILITGSTKKDVTAAKRRMLTLIKSARRRQPFTHFISLPLNDSSFKNGFLKFKSDVLKTGLDRGVEESIFQSVDKLHLTLCTMVLCDDSERKCASTVLENCKEEVIRPLLSGKKLTLCMSGVEYMNDDPSEVDVLYGKVFCKDEPELLQKLADDVVSYFVEQELADQQYERVKLHVTLMNTIFRKNAMSSEENNGKRETFDARSILRNFQNFFFGEGEVPSIDISLRYSTAESGYYIATASLQIP